MLKKIKEFRKYIIGFLIGSGLLVGVTALALQVSQTGTGLTNVPNGAMLSGSTTNQTLVVTPIGSNGYVWTSNGTIPSWQPATGGGTGSITTSTTASIGKVAIWTGLSTLGNGSLFDNGTVAGVNATSSTVNFNVQGTTTNDPFNVSSSSGTSILRVTSGGNVGIGTTTPGQSFVVVGSTTLTSLGTGCVNSTATGGLFSATCATTVTSSGTAGTIQFAGAAGTFNANLLNFWDNTKLFQGYGTSTPWARLAVQDIATSTAATTTAAFDVASSSGASYLWVAHNGNVGINSGTPGSLLSLQGTAGSTTNLLTVASSTNATIFRVASNGRVGIGTATPASTLSVVGVAGNIQPFAVTSSTGTSLFNVDISGNTTAAGVVIGSAVLVTGGCIKDGGGSNRLCVGDPNQFSSGSVQGPTENNKWFVVGSSSTPFSFATIQENSGSTLNRPIFNVATSSGASYFLVSRTGNVGIGTTTPGQALVTIGSIQQTAVTNCNDATHQLGADANGVIVCDTSLSDSRLKKNVKPLNGNDSLSLFSKINFVSFNWKDSSKGVQKQFGVIAQEVQKVFPNLVTKEKDGYFSMNYQGLFVQMGSALQELSGKVTAILARLDTQDKKIKNQQTQLDRQQHDIDYLKGQINDLKKGKYAN